MTKIPNVVNMFYGSRLYGTATPESDTDFAGVYMPTMTDLLLQKIGKGTSKSTGKQHQKNGKDDIDSVMFALPRFVRLCLDGDTTAIDMLHCEHPIESNWIWDDLVKYRTKFYSKNMKAYVGYVKSQAMKYGMKGDRLAELSSLMSHLDNIIDEGYGRAQLGDHIIWTNLPVSEFIFKKYTDDHYPSLYSVLDKKYQDTNTIEYLRSRLQDVWDGYGARAKTAMDNGGMDWKAIHHSLRVLYQVREIFENGDFSYPLKETEFLMKVKRGDADYATEIAPEFDKFFETYKNVAANSDLPDKTDEVYWEKWLIGVYDLWFNITYRETLPESVEDWDGY